MSVGLKNITIEAHGSWEMGREWVSRTAFRVAFDGVRTARKTKKAFIKYWRGDRLTQRERGRLNRVKFSQARRHLERL